MKNNNILYIGLNGWAGSGKDTVAKALTIMLEHDFKSYDEFKEYYDEHAGYDIKGNFKYATFDSNKTNNKSDKQQNYNKVMCIAFADRLKQLCANMFGVPLDRFYYNKENAYICINKDFSYIETKPYDGQLVSAADYYWDYDNYFNSDIRYYMSLREILVYVGTYVVQSSINKNTFINSVANTITNEHKKNDNLQYAICTDVRFISELNFVNDMHGITIHIDRPGIKRLDNIAEKALSENNDTEEYNELFDFYITNDGTYDDLFKKVWNLVHDNIVFSNETYELQCRDDSNNYIRKVSISEDESEVTFELCNEFPISAAKSDGMNIAMLDPQGGPMIAVDDELITIDDVQYYVDSISDVGSGERTKFYINTYIVD